MKISIRIYWLDKRGEEKVDLIRVIFFHADNHINTALEEAYKEGYDLVDISTYFRAHNAGCYNATCPPADT